MVVHPVEISIVWVSDRKEELLLATSLLLAVSGLKIIDRDAKLVDNEAKEFL